MYSVELGSELNLEGLRQQVTRRLAAALLLCSVALIMITWPHPAAPLGVVVPWAVWWAAAGGVAWLTQSRWPSAARALLLCLLTGGVAGIMWFSPAAYAPFLGLLLPFTGAALIQGGGAISTAAVGVLATWLTATGARSYPLAELWLALALATVLSWQTIRTLFVALDWAWTMQRRADQLLELARERQAELSQTLKSLDISNELLRRTQHELIFARRQAEQARRMKEQFAANISHELRTPLSLILGFSEVMYLSPEVYGPVDWPPALRQDVYQIYRSSRHLLDMIDDVLDLSRFELAEFTLDKEPTPLDRLLREAAEIAQGLFRAPGIRFELDIAPDLPTLYIDRTRIRQVLLNLLNNAARFTEAGVVRLKAQRDQGEVIISVSDTGPGIPKDELPHLFEEFYQVDRSLQRRHGGAGLGLAISKRFVEAHDGRIWVESEEGVGSTFSFSLPIPEEYRRPSPVTLGAPLEMPGRQVKPILMVVERDPTVVAMIRRHLAEYEVIQLDDEMRLAEATAWWRPRAILWNLRPGSSPELPPSLPAAVPIIECSLPSHAWLADELLVADCLAKPITTDRLWGALHRLGNVRDVLIIDDDRDFCHMVRRMLQVGDPEGRLSVRSAYHATGGIQEMRSRLPDVVLLDLVMPEKDGFQVLEEMRADATLRQARVILLTATSYAEDALIQEGGRLTVSRPGDTINPSEMLKCIQAIVGVLGPRHDAEERQPSPQGMPVAAAGHNGAHRISS